ncbi:hypothetical protein [Streptomyces sp.]|uniref:hypothetical protein n=1 Tax=Streptomyces sp. TaxID=1931 RepID=UPI002F946FD7
MKHGVLAALDQRISISYQMPTMTKEETASYIKHHLTIAGREDTLAAFHRPAAALWADGLAAGRARFTVGP